MRNMIKVFGIIILSMVIGFGMMACGDSPGNDPDDPNNPNTPNNPNNPVSGSGKYNGKDVLGNTYSLSVGSDAARSAKKGDRFNMEVHTRGGKKNINGIITEKNSDGTLSLKQDGSNNTFTAIVDEEGEIETVFSDNLTQSGFAPRTFDNVFLRAVRWSNGTFSGENWGSGTSVLVKDFPANVSALSFDSNRYTITVSGTSDTKIDNLRIEVQGLTASNEWIWLGSSTKAQNKVCEANVPFNHVITVDLINNFAVSGVSPNFMNYKEIILQVTNRIKITDTANPSGDENNGTLDVDDGTIMATISDFNIVLKDKNKAALTGNMGEYTYGIKDDGISPEYRMVMWILSAENIAKAKQAGAKLEIGFKDGAAIENNGAALEFVWQDSVRGLWWQDSKQFAGNENDGTAEDPDWNFKTATGATWDNATGKMTLTLSNFVGTEFANATDIRILIMCNWWGMSGDSFSIDELEIVHAEIK